MEKFTVAQAYATIYVFIVKKSPESRLFDWLCILGSKVPYAFSP